MVTSKKGILFTENLEHISRHAIEKYPHVLKDFIVGRHGIYALYSRKKLVYVGLTSDLRSRLSTHLKDRHANSWDEFSVYLTRSETHLRDLEALLIKISEPRDNKKKSRFISSENLIRRFKQAMRDYQDGELNEVIGVRPKRQKRNAFPLEGHFKYSTPLKLTYKGKDYFARVKKNGMIHFNKRDYSSPSTAASAISRHPMNGWLWWRFKQKGKWVLLNTLRK